MTRKTESRMSQNIGEVLKNRVEKVLEEFDKKPVVEGCVRVGVKRSGNTDPCPNKFSLRNSDHVAQVLTSANKLCSKEGTDLCTYP